MDRMVWLLCPVCGNKTRLKVRQDTELINFPLYYPKCKQETLTILLFCAIYLTYFGAMMFLFKRVILRPEMR